MSSQDPGKVVCVNFRSLDMVSEARIRKLKLVLELAEMGLNVTIAEDRRFEVEPKSRSVDKETELLDAVRDFLDSQNAEAAEPEEHSGEPAEDSDSKPVTAGGDTGTPLKTSRSLIERTTDAVHSAVISVELQALIDAMNS